MWPSNRHAGQLDIVILYSLSIMGITVVSILFLRGRTPSPPIVKSTRRATAYSQLGAVGVPPGQRGGCPLVIRYLGATLLSNARKLVGWYEYLRMGGNALRTAHSASQTHMGIYGM